MVLVHSQLVITAKARPGQKLHVDGWGHFSAAFYLFERQSYNENGRGLLVHSQDDCNRQGWAKPKSGASHGWWGPST